MTLVFGFSKREGSGFFFFGWRSLMVGMSERHLWGEKMVLISYVMPHTTIYIDSTTVL